MGSIEETNQFRGRKHPRRELRGLTLTRSYHFTFAMAEKTLHNISPFAMGHPAHPLRSTLASRTIKTKRLHHFDQDVSRQVFTPHCSLSWPIQLVRLMLQRPNPHPWQIRQQPKGHGIQLLMLFRPPGEEWMSSRSMHKHDIQQPVLAPVRISEGDQSGHPLTVDSRFWGEAPDDGAGLRCHSGVSGALWKQISPLPC